MGLQRDSLLRDMRISVVASLTATVVISQEASDHFCCGGVGRGGLLFEEQKGWRNQLLIPQAFCPSRGLLWAGPAPASSSRYGLHPVSQVPGWAWPPPCVPGPRLGMTSTPSQVPGQAGFSPLSMHRRTCGVGSGGAVAITWSARNWAAAVKMQTLTIWLC